ncbi:MAG TPA: hypothetical protein VJQ50_16355 [Terriglobales bacterium]|nr:hypothetical protein [Terriglobales bacterium]
MRLLLVFGIAVALSGAFSLFAKDNSTEQSKTVCVAVVANASTISAFVEQMTERLVKSLKEDKVDAVGMNSRTTTHYPLEFSKANGEESRQKQCDYILLSQIRDPRQHPFEPRLPEISIGGPVPSTDASNSSPIAKPNVQVAFALFQSGRFKPIVDTYVLDRPGPNAANTLWLAMDTEANRVRSELKKVRLPE